MWGAEKGIGEGGGMLLEGCLKTGVMWRVKERYC